MDELLCLSKRKCHFQRKIKSPEFKKVWALCEKANREVDVFKIYGVDAYLGSLSLSVSSAYRGQKLGYHLLSARSAPSYIFVLRGTTSDDLFSQTGMRSGRGTG